MKEEFAYRVRTIDIGALTTLEFLPAPNRKEG
jgi:hypothetical protein